MSVQSPYCYELVLRKLSDLNENSRILLVKSQMKILTNCCSYTSRQVLLGFWLCQISGYSGILCAIHEK